MTPEGNPPVGMLLPFHAVLAPHRALRPGMLVRFLAVLAILVIMLACVFALLGAWPVSGIFGLEVAAICVALGVNGLRARAREHILVTYSHLRVRKVDRSGNERDWAFNPLWIRLERKTDGGIEVAQLALRTRGCCLVIADMLPPCEKATLASALDRALAAARRGPDFPTPA
jgi:uncharacterized membrane protein